MAAGCRQERTLAARLKTLMRGIAGADPQDPNRGADLGGAAAEVGLCEGGEVGVRGDDAGEEVRVDDRVLDVSAVRSRADKRCTLYWSPSVY